jgi:hypothetical protein
VGLRNSTAVGQSVVRAATGITIRENSPFARCFTCLARQLMVTETMVREVAQVLVVRDEFVLDQRVCYTCQRVEDLLVPAEAAVVGRGAHQAGFVFSPSWRTFRSQHPAW